MEVIFAQQLKQSSAMIHTDCGSVMETSDVHPLKALQSINVNVCVRQCNGGELGTVFESMVTDLCQCLRQCNEGEFVTVFEGSVTDIYQCVR